MLNDKKVFAIVMAGGKGTRIGATDEPKVMFEVAGKPIIEWAIRPFEELKKQGIIDRLIVVVGFHGEMVVDYLGDRAEFVWQKEQLGTAHAVRQAENLITGEEGITLISNGDHTLYSADTFKKVLNETIAKQAVLGFAIIKSSNRFGSYGRVIMDKNGNVKNIVETLNATDEQKKIPYRNPNLYAVDNVWLFEALKKVQLNPVKKEFYLTDIIEIAVGENKKIITVEIDNIDEALGINTKEDKEEAEKLLTRLNN